MTSGPPASEAGPSRSHDASTHPVPPLQPPQNVQGQGQSSMMTTFSVQSPSGPSQTAPPQYHSQPYGSTQPIGGSTAASSYAYYNYPQAWNNSWQAYSYNPSNAAAYPYAYSQAPRQQQSLMRPLAPAVPSLPQKRKAPVPSPSPSPPPPPPFHNEWDRVIKDFLTAAGLTQALRGFETDMIVMSSDWERKGVPVALKELSENLSVCLSRSYHILLSF